MVENSTFSICVFNSDPLWTSSPLSVVMKTTTETDNDKSKNVVYARDLSDVSTMSIDSPSAQSQREGQSNIAMENQVVGVSRRGNVKEYNNSLGTTASVTGVWVFKKKSMKMVNLRNLNAFPVHIQSFSKKARIDYKDED